VRLDAASTRIDAAPVPVSVRYRGSRGPRVSSSIVRARAERMLAALSRQDAELSILLCDGAVMRVLNRRHRGHDRATDVLAFPMSETEPQPDGAQCLLGDIVISVPTASRQARAAGKAVLAEITMLLAHGLLHLLGYDHRDETEQRRMSARTDMLVSTAVPGAAKRGGQNRVTGRMPARARRTGRAR
jgi:probable rRNA maturation factor